MLISTKPDSKGKEAAIFRARQLTEFKWTPLRDIPVYTKATGKTKLPAGEMQQGIIYSSTEPTDKFIGENISFETFLSVIANPDSALYHKNLNGHNNSWAYFGIVCNGFIRYAFDIRYRYPTKRWQDIPGMHKISDQQCYTVEQIQLCDVLHAFCKEHTHVSLVTDILRDEMGKIQLIEVSEAVRPTCVRKHYKPETFYEKFRLFALWRYDFVDAVPMPDAQQNKLLEQGVPELPVIAVDYGNKTNYRSYEDVLISVFADGENELEISRDGEVVERTKIHDRGNLVRKFNRGYYTVKHVNTGKFVEFCVTMPAICHKVENGMITIKADPCDTNSIFSHMDFRDKGKAAAAKEAGIESPVYYSDQCASLVKVEELTDEEKKAGIFARKIPEDAVNFKIYFENKYGIWTHTMIKI